MPLYTACKYKVSGVCKGKKNQKTHYVPKQTPQVIGFKNFQIVSHKIKQTEEYLEPSRTSTMEPFCGNSSWIKDVDYFWKCFWKLHRRCLTEF